jgi:hypothetical protein
MRESRPYGSVRGARGETRVPTASVTCWHWVMRMIAHPCWLLGAPWGDNRTAMAATMAVFSTAVAVCVVLLMAYDRPFAFGGVTLF